ncbi:MAG TPA: glycosyltransferase family 4 protein [Noviherbaspirillum sp.]|nr:glycosyltransferase family 4 protein [Noviherbaspirillum sp.]
MLRIALVTNHPPPFRIPIYNEMARTPGIDLNGIFCSPREPNRQWDLPPMRFRHVFLKERFVQRGSNFIHNNPDVFRALKQIQPDVVVTTGFNPTHLYAFGYALLRGIPHVPMTDGTDQSEQALTGLHKMIRRMVYARSRAFIAASHGGLRLYRAYGIDGVRCFQSCLCTDNDAFSLPHLLAPERKRYDLIFCGRIVQDKNPLFTLEVAAGAARRLGRRVSLLYVGTGEQDAEVREEAARQTEWVHVTFHGHASQLELPNLYASARIFMFPTVHDAWGVVANEACASGLPIIVSPHAGVAGELVVDGENGFVCELDAAIWADRLALLLTNDALYDRFSRRSLAIVGNYTFAQAANGIIDACRFAVGEPDSGKLDPAGRKWG